jgi:DNA-binding IclR family transcriptional regulator
MLPKQPNQSLIEGIRCLQGVVSANSPLGASEVARSLEIELTKAHRLLRTLAHMGLLRQNADRKFSAGPGLSVLAAQAMQGSHLLQAALPALESLRRETPYIVAMGVLWLRSVTFVYHARHKSSLEKAIGGHDLLPATNSGLGMALLSQHSDEAVSALYATEPPAQGIPALLESLQEIRREGYAYITTSPTTVTLAIPLSSHKDAAIGVSGGISREEIPPILDRLRVAAEEISSQAHST